MRYRVEKPSNPQCRIFKLRRRIADQTHLTDVGSDAPARIKRLFADLLKIRGITSASVSPYEVAVHKADLFDWEKILPRVSAVLKKHFSPKQAMTAI